MIYTNYIKKMIDSVQTLLIKISENSFKKTQCFFVKSNKKKYIIMNYHSFYNNLYLEHSSGFYKINGKIKNYPSIDLTIIEIDINECKYYDISKNNLQLNDTSNYKNYLLVPFEDNFKIIQCSHIRFNNCSYNIESNLMPCITCNLLNKEDLCLDGASGSILFNENQVYGILSGSHDSTGYFIPIILINEILKNLKDLVLFNYKINSQNIILNNINCNKNHPEFKFQRNKNLKKNDIIKQIDGHKILDNNMTFDENLQINIHISDYLKIYKNKKSLNHFLVERKNKLIEVISGNVENEVHELSVKIEELKL